MRKFLSYLISSFIPSRVMRRRVRSIIRFGIVKYHATLRRERGKHFNNFLAIVAIAKNEGIYFKEWIEYHLLVGVEKFYIYDNESDDGTKDILQPYIDKGIVEYTYFPGDGVQLNAYVDCLSRHKNDTKWLALIDLDEFIIPIATETIPELLKKFPLNVAQLVIGWQLYGSNGHTTRPEGLVIENYTKRGETPPSGIDCKSIVNPRLVRELACHEHDIAGDNIKEYQLAISAQRIRINHYSCKSWEDYQRKHTRGSGFYGLEAGRKLFNKSHFDSIDLNDIYDPIMNKYVEQVKDAVQGQNS